MGKACRKVGRLKKALEYRGIEPGYIDIGNLGTVLTKRGITDAMANGIIWDLIAVLEPPCCEMTHCEHYGNTVSFCSCVLERIPGQCPTNRAFMKRNRERAAKAASKLMDVVGERTFSRDQQPHKFFNLLEEREEFAFVKKWNSTLRKDVWKQLQKEKV